MIICSFAGSNTCGSKGSGNTLEITEDIPKKCQNENVCQVDCKLLYPSCPEENLHKRTVFFGLKLQSNPVFSSAYEKVCLERKFSQFNERQSFFLTVRELLESILPQHLRSSWKELFGYSSLFTFLKESTISKTKKTIGFGILKMVSIYRTFVKVCTQKRGWRENLKKNIYRLNNLTHVEIPSKSKIIPFLATDEEKIQYIRINLKNLYSGLGSRLIEKISNIKNEINEEIKDFSREDLKNFNHLRAKLVKEFIIYIQKKYHLTATKEYCRCLDFEKYPQYVKERLNGSYYVEDVRRAISSLILMNVPSALPEDLILKAKDYMLKGLEGLEKDIEKSRKTALRDCKNLCSRPVSKKR